jgi:hypothetical protein
MSMSGTGRVTRAGSSSLLSLRRMPADMVTFARFTAIIHAQASKLPERDIASFKSNEYLKSAVQMEVIVRSVIITAN